MTAVLSLDGFIGVLLPLFLYGIYYTMVKRKRLPYPPGPKGWPIVGNLFDPVGSGEYQWLAYKDLSDKYNSDIIHISILGTHIIVVSSQTAAYDLFDARSTIYSERPHSVMMSELAGLDWNLGLRPYDSGWRDRRTFFRKVFHAPALNAYHSLILNATRVLLKMILLSPANYMRHLRHMAGTIILLSAYGIDVKPEHDSYVALSEQGQNAFAKFGRPGAYFVDLLPCMRYIPSWMPGAHFKREAYEARKYTEAVPRVPLDFVKRSMTEGSARSSIASTCFQELEDEKSWTPEKEEVIRDVLGVMYMAGADTTVSAIGSFIIAMVLNPEVQKKAQATVDSTVGTSRLPDLSDRHSMPYIDAVMMETLRWRPVTPIAVPHACAVDNVYRGNFIPKGSIVIGNVWAMLHDPSVYGVDTHLFNPERFMNGEHLNSNIPKPDVAFGFGRRLCAGKEAAETSLWINIASLLATFDFSGKGNLSEEVIGQNSSGLVSYPPEIKCQITPRSEQAVNLIQEGMLL